MSTAVRPPLLVTLVATALGAGLLPGAPGTYGTLVAVPLAFVLQRQGQAYLLAGAALATVIGIWAADRYCEATGQQDNQQVVIDEVAGYLLTLALGPPGLVNLGLGFLLFRLFDIWKPWPVRVIDERVHGGLGVMADDLAAGVYAALGLWGLHWLYGWLSR